VNRQAIVAIAAMLGMFLTAIDQTAVGTAMPSIVRAFGGLALYSWVFAGYQLAFVVTTPVFGRLADLYGRRRVYLAGILGFVGASVLCGMSRSMEQLVVFRLLQGIGGGAVLPIALTIVADLYPVEQRLKIQGIFSSVWGLAAILGPLFGGFLADHASWRWIFFLNVPAGLIATAIIATSFTDPPPVRTGRLDYAGIGLLTGASVTLLLLLLWGGQSFPWWSFATAAFAALLMLMVWLLVRVERHSDQPFLPFALFRDRVVTVSTIGGFLLGASMFGAVVYLPLFVQGVIGTSATTAGLALIPFTVCWTFGSIAGGRFALRWGFRPVIATGMALLVGGFILLSGLTAQSSVSGVLGPMAILGTAMGMTATMFMIAMQNAVGRTLRGVATSINIFSRNIGSAIGISLQGAVLVHVVTGRLRALAGGTALGIPQIANPQQLLDQSVQAQLTPAAHEAFRQVLAQALHSIFVLSLGLTALGLILVVVYMPGGSVAELSAADANDSARRVHAAQGAPAD
jgi:EmrB/QacA subfamily drug resistance transporter